MAVVWLEQAILCVIAREGAGARPAQAGPVAGCVVEPTLLVSLRHWDNFSQIV